MGAIGKRTAPQRLQQIRRKGELAVRRQAGENICIRRAGRLIEADCESGEIAAVVDLAGNCRIIGETVRLAGPAISDEVSRESWRRCIEYEENINSRRVARSVRRDQMQRM